jgi:hypothetical protein
MVEEISEPVERWTAKRRATLVLAILKQETTVAEAARCRACHPGSRGPGSARRKWTP